MRRGPGSGWPARSRPGPPSWGGVEAYDGDLIADGRLHALAEQCAGLERQIAQRNRAAAASQTVTPYGRRDFLLFESTTSTLRVLREGLGSLIQGAVSLRDGCATSGRRRDLIARVDEAASPGAAAGPVRWLLDLADALGQATAPAGRAVLDALAARQPTATADLSNVPRALQSRLALLTRVVDQLDAWGASAEAWETLRRSVPDLIPAAQGTVALLRGYQSDVRLVETVCAEDGIPRFLHTGLTFRAPGTTLPTRLRPVTFAVVPDIPAEAGALLELASWLDASSQSADDLPALCRNQAATLRHFASAGDWWSHADDEERARLWGVLQRIACWLRRPGHEADPAAVQWRLRKSAGGLGAPIATASDLLWTATLDVNGDGSPDGAEGLARDALAGLLDAAAAQLQSGVPKADRIHSRLDTSFAARLDAALTSIREWCRASRSCPAPGRSSRGCSEWRSSPTNS